MHRLLRLSGFSDPLYRLHRHPNRDDGLVDIELVSFRFRESLHSSVDHLGQEVDVGHLRMCFQTACTVLVSQMRIAVHMIVKIAAIAGKKPARVPITVPMDSASPAILTFSGALTQSAKRR